MTFLENDEIIIYNLIVESMWYNLCIFLGGTEDVEKSTGKRYRKGFVGCISDFVINTDYHVKLSWSTGTEHVCIS